MGYTLVTLSVASSVTFYRLHYHGYIMDYIIGCIIGYIIRYVTVTL